MKQLFILFVILLSFSSCSEDCGERVALIEEKFDKEIQWLRDDKPVNGTEIELQAWSKRYNAILNEKRRAVDNACD